MQRDHGSDGEEHEQPPAAEVDEPEDERQPDGPDEQPRDERTHRPPKRRRRLAYSSSAERSSSFPKSGHRVSTNTSSAYADCHRRKLEIRCSPDVRMTRSGSGISGAYRNDANVRSSSSTPAAAARRAASTISARPP